MTHSAQHFTILLQIKVNGRDFYTFQHRMPLERVCAMHIGGDVSIQTINVIGVRLPVQHSTSYCFSCTDGLEVVIIGGGVAADEIVAAIYLPVFLNITLGKILSMLCDIILI